MLLSGYPNTNETFYRIFYDSTGIYSIISINYLNEYKYDQTKFLRLDLTNEPIFFINKEDALKFLNKNYSEEQINQEDRRYYFKEN